MKRGTRLTVVNNIPMIIFDENEMISDDIIKHNNFYEHNIFNQWVTHFPNNGLMLDIGANIGNHSLQFKSKFPDLEIWCFEPDYENYKLLRKNIKKFKDIKCFNVGVGSATSVVNFTEGHASNSGCVKITPNGKNYNIVLSLDNVKFYDKKISMIKLDIEGHELSAIEGMVNLIKEHKPIIWVEDFTKKTIEYLNKIGYKTLDVKEFSNYLMIYE